MINLLVAASVAFAAAPMVRAPTSNEIDLGPTQRWALISGLENQLGGKFIIIGLKGAKADCDVQKVCASGDTILRDNEAKYLRPKDLSVGRKPVAAIVSVLTASNTPQGFDVVLSVYDVKSGAVTQRRAEIGYRGGEVSTQELRRLVIVES